MQLGRSTSGHGLAASAPRATEADNSARTAAGRLKNRFGAYLALTKPRVIELLLVATIPTMLLADRGSANLPLILATLFGGCLGAAGANTLNCVVDADIDKRMKRTERRPLARDAVSTRNALIFGVVLTITSFLWLWWATNLLSGLLVVATVLFYVLIYTMVLKRRTSQNVVWGGAAGCMPTLVGWSAVTGTIQWPALALFAVIFFWTPPHTWALAMRYKQDYADAGVPMLPVVATEELVTRRIVIYVWATVAASLALIPAAGVIYAITAVILGAWFIVLSHRLAAGVRRGDPIKPLRLFLQSNNYLAILCCGLAVDSILAFPTVMELLGS